MTKFNWPADLGADLAALESRLRILESAPRATRTQVDTNVLSGNIIASQIGSTAWSSDSWSITGAGLAAPMAGTPTSDTYGSASQQIAWSDGTTAAPAAYLERRADGTLILYNGTDPASTIQLSSINAIVTGNLEVVGSLLVDNALYAATPALRYELRSSVRTVPTNSSFALAMDFTQATGKNPPDGTGLTGVTDSGVPAIQIGRRGIYRISITVGFPSNSTGTRAAWIALGGGGGRIVEDEKGADGGGPTVCTATADVGLNAGQVVVPWCFQGSGAGMSVGAGTTNSYPGFSVVYVCDATIGTSYTPPPPPPPPPTPPPPTTGTFRSCAFGSMAWTPGWGWRMVDDNPRQGDGGTWDGGDLQRGFFFHDPAGFVSGLAGKTPTGGRMWICRQSGAGYSAAAPIGIWTHHVPNYGGGADLDGNHDPGQSLAWGAGAWINLPTWVCNDLKSGTKNGLALARPGADCYGVFDGRSIHVMNGAIDIDWTSP